MAKTRITVVEDQRELRDIMVTMLKSKGFDVIAQFDNGADALEKLDRENTDILISDIEMPKMTGLELIRELRASGFDKPSYCWSSIYFTAEGLGFDGAYDKSQFRELVTAIKQKIAA